MQKQTFLKSLTDQFWKIPGIRSWWNAGKMTRMLDQLSLSWKISWKTWKPCIRWELWTTFKFPFMQGRLAQAQLIEVLNLTALSLDSVVMCTHLCNFCEVWIASCYVTEAGTPRKTAKTRIRMSQWQLTLYGYLKDHSMIAKLHWDAQRVADDTIKYFLLEFVLVWKLDHWWG